MIAKGYMFSKDPWHYSSKIPYRVIGDFEKLLKKENSGNKLLDVGVGNARHAIYFTKKNFRVWGIDISESAIKFARYNCKLNNCEINLRLGDVLSLPYSKNSFDVIIDSGCFHHLRKIEWPIYLKNINKVLKKRGYLFLLTFSNKTQRVNKLGVRQGKYKNWSVRNHHYYHYFSKKEIEKIFDSDFNILKCYDIRRSNSPIYFKIIYIQKK